MNLLKTLLFIIVPFSFAYNLYCAEQDSLLSPLTEIEQSCFNWFEENKNSLKSVYLGLSQEDQKIMQNKILYKDNPQAVKRVVFNYAKNFCLQALEANIKLEFDEETIGKTLLKMKIALQNKTISKPTNLITARMYVFSQLLTPEEKSTVLRDNYLTNPDATKAAMKKCATLLAIEVAKLGLIEDTDEAKKEFANQFLYKKMIELEHTYKSVE